MGCDYVISKMLYVHYCNSGEKMDGEMDTKFFVIELSRIGAYFVDDFFDIYDPDYEAKLRENEAKQLTPNMQPIVLYEDGRFKTALYESKYKQMIETEMSVYDTQWSDIIKVVKMEERYRRY